MPVVIQDFEAVAEPAGGEDGAPAAEGGRRMELATHDLERELGRIAARRLRRWAH